MIDSGHDGSSEHRKNQARSVLRFLKDHEGEWVTTWELVEATSHRFSTSIQKLREQGYEIEKKPIVGSEQFQYRLTSYRRKVLVDKSLKDLYYNTPHWRAMSKQRREFDDWRCVLCKSTENLEVHHFHYDLFEEDIEDLVTLCRNCHRRLHVHAKDKLRSFPKSVAVDIEQRIRNGGKPKINYDNDGYGQLFSD